MSRSFDVERDSGLMIHRTALDATNGLHDIERMARRKCDILTLAARATRWAVTVGIVMLFAFNLIRDDA